MKRRNFLSLFGLGLFTKDDLPIREVTIQREEDGTYSVWHKDEVNSTILVSKYDQLSTALTHAYRFLIQDRI